MLKNQRINIEFFASIFEFDEKILEVFLRIMSWLNINKIYSPMGGIIITYL